MRVPRQVGSGFRRCSRAKCRLCPYTNLRQGQVLQSVTISNTGESLPINGKINCTKTSTLYLITCSEGHRTCPNNPQYCGQSGKSCEVRFVGHRDSVIQTCHDHTTLPVEEHFRGAGHSLSDLVFTPVEQVHGNVFVRLAREKLMINRFNLINNGLNKTL